MEALKKAVENLRKAQAELDACQADPKRRGTLAHRIADDAIYSERDAVVKAALAAFPA